MLWNEIREAYPDQWLIVEALEAHTTPDRHRQLDRMAVVEKCSDGSLAMKGCRRLYQRFPDREFYFVHTSRGELEIRERWPDRGGPDRDAPRGQTRRSRRLWQLVPQRPNRSPF